MDLPQKREPSIHITRTNFFEIMDELGYTYKDVSRIFKKAKSYSISTRSFIISDDKLRKEVGKLVESKRHDAAIFAQLIYVIRKNKKHLGITPMKPSDKSWGTLKVVAANALKFFTEFEFKNRKDAFTKYIEIGINKMKRFNLNKFLTMHEVICETYQAMVEIENDDDKDITQEMYKIYIRYIIGRIGMYDKEEETPERYVWFVRARNQARDMNISFKIFINAQIEAFDFMERSPHPAQLVGLKATDRVMEYMYKHGIKINRK